MNERGPVERLDAEDHPQFGPLHARHRGPLGDEADGLVSHFAREEVDAAGALQQRLGPHPGPEPIGIDGPARGGGRSSGQQPEDQQPGKREPTNNI